MPRIAAANISLKMQKLLIIAQNWPEPNSSAAGIRMAQLIDLFLERDFEITFACTSSESDYSMNLKNLGVKLENVQPNDESYNDFLREENPQLVLFDRFMLEEQFGWRVSEICPNALRILDTEDLHFLRKARQEAVKNKRDFQEIDLFSEVAKREIASILRCDLSLIISEVEKEILINQFRIAESLLFYLPFLFEKFSKNTLENLPSFDERTEFVSIGNFLHPPNLDQTIYLKEEIWPLISKKIPEAELHIYGAYANDKVKRLHSPESHFFIEGRAENVEDVLKHARILLAPLRFGAGLKGKFFDAMQTGTPSITTSIGAEGICGDMVWCGKIADTPETLVETAVSLYQNKPDWENAQRAGIEIINCRFQKSMFAEAFFQELQRLQNELKTHRQNNFMGAMLMHHTLRSTKYMSKWIEAKNKKSKD